MRLILGTLATFLLAFTLVSTDFAISTDGLEVGDTAPDFELENVDGKMVSLDDYYPDAKGYIVIFTCNTCPFAKMYEERIIALHEAYAQKGLPVIAINPNDPNISPGDSFVKMQNRAKEKGYPFPYLFDEEQTVFPAYGATRTPHVFLLDDERTVHYIGAIDDNAQDPDAVETKYVEKAIAAMVAGKKADPDFTRAVGCSIKSAK